jgi:hypothetical protein
MMTTGHAHREASFDIHRSSGISSDITREFLFRLDSPTGALSQIYARKGLDIDEDRSVFAQDLKPCKIRSSALSWRTSQSSGELDI